MEKCQEFGDPYMDCEGEVRFRENHGQHLCSAHMGAHTAINAREGA